MIRFWLTGFGLGALISAYTALYFYVLLKLRNLGLRILWGCIHCGMIIALIFSTNYILNSYYPENKEHNTRLIFLLLWIVPYALSVLFGVMWLISKGKGNGS
jgi:hypothetical protein